MERSKVSNVLFAHLIVIKVSIILLGVHDELLRGFYRKFFLRFGEDKKSYQISISKKKIKNPRKWGYHHLRIQVE